MAENHAIQRDLGGSGPDNETLIEAALRHGALAAKLAGAGGGGTIIALHPDPAWLGQRLAEAGADRVLFPTVSEGVRVEERAVAQTGAVMVAGVDEVGRGALFGPVVAAAVILPPECRIRGLRDSKQLEREDRERLAKIVEKRAVCYAIEEVDAETIDRVNIYQASKLAMLGAVARLMPAADHLLIDAMRLDHPCAQTSIIYGDSLSISIAAASVIAKVYRDRRMCEYHQQWPQYGLHSHKGYSTPEHKRALAEHGPTPLHRFSFRPVAQRSLPWDYPTALDTILEGEQLVPTADVRNGAP